MAKITLDISTDTGLTALHAVLVEINARNSMFTVEFVKKNGELANRNGIPCKKTAIRGTGTVNHSRTHKAEMGIFVFYSLKETAVQREICDVNGLDPKTLDWKSVYLQNILFIRAGGNEYEITGGKPVVE